MRCATSYDFRTSKRRGGAKKQSRPREGTRLRAVFDLFMASRGEPIEFHVGAGGSGIRDLTDYYGLDIRCMGHGRWILAGEWFGRVYIDYIAERLSPSQPNHNRNEKQHSAGDQRSAACAGEISFGHGRLAWAV